MPRSSEKLVRFGCRYAPGMAGHVYTGYGYFLAEYNYLYQVYFQKMTPGDTSSKKCFQRSKKIQSRYTPSMAEELWDLQDICSGYGSPQVCLKNHGISEKCGTVGVASLQVWPRIVVK